MRSFLAILGVTVVAMILIAGRRGDVSRNSPLYIFPDMDRQLKLRPMTPNGFFANGVSSQPYPEGTVAQSTPVLVNGKAVYPYENVTFNTGLPAGAAPGATNFVDLNPMPVTAQSLERGRQRFNIYCSPCHGAQGDGNGITKKIGAMALVTSLHDKRVVGLPDGEIFNTVSHGRGQMQAYGAQIPVADRWAIIAYVRALQLSRLGTEADLTTELRAKLTK